MFFEKGATVKLLETRRLVLRPVEKEDTYILSKWRETTDYKKFVFSGQRQLYHLQFMILLKKERLPIGVIYTFSYNKVDGFLFLNVFLSAKHRKNGYGAEACLIVICDIFDHLSIYKIYCDAFSCNNQSIQMMEGIGLKQEGFLRGHRFYNGKRYDVIRFAIYENNLEKIRLLLQRLKKDSV